MNETLLIPNERYLYRIDWRQVPVLYNGYRPWGPTGKGSRNHTFTRQDTGEWIYRRHAGGVSHHYEGWPCAQFNGLTGCMCRERLAEVR
jgi:hypothetical protein